MVFNNEASSSSYGLNPVSPEETPLLPKPKLLSSQPKTFANVFIAVVGAGALGLPYSFKRTGWVVSLLMLFSVALLTHHCMMLLVRTRRRLESVMGFTNIASFGDLGFTVCGPVGRFAVDLMLFLSQAGFYVGYLIFIADTLANLFNSATLTNLHPRILGLMPKSLYIWGCFPFQLGLNSISTLTHLAPLSIFANLGSGWVSMGDGGVACKPLQHIMERLSIPEACCGGNNDNGFNSNSLKLEDSEPKKMKKVKKVIKKVVRKEVKRDKQEERAGAMAIADSDSSDFRSVVSHQRRELVEAQTRESDLDFAFRLQLEEALVASMSSLPSTSSSPPRVQNPITDCFVSGLRALQTDELDRLEQEVRDRQQSEAEMRKLREDIRRRAHDQKLAREISHMPEKEWEGYGDNYERPFGEGSSSGEVFRFLFKGLVREEKVGSSRDPVMGIGVAICDFRNNLVFELQKPLVACGKSHEFAETRAMIEALNTALALDLKRVDLFCDHQPLYQR